MSDKMDQAYLTDYLLEYQTNKDIFDLKTCPKFLFTSIDDLFDSLIISNKLFQIIVQSDMIREEVQQMSIGDCLFQYPKTTELIFKTILNDTVQFYAVKDMPTNILLKIPATEKAMEAIKLMCLNLNLSCSFNDIYPRKNFEPINLNVYDNSKDKFTFIEMDYTKGKSILPNWNIGANKIYVQIYKNKSWTNFNNNDINLRYYNRILRIKWYKLLVPIAMHDDCINVPFMNKYIWNEINNKIKLKVDLNILYKCLKVYPTQLVGVTNLVMFRHKLKGNEAWANNFKRIYENNVMQWTAQYNNNLMAEIYRLIHYQYNYLGDNIYEKELRASLIYHDYDTLKEYDYPKNLIALDFLLGGKLNREIYSTWENTLAAPDPKKFEFVLKYLDII